MCIQRRSSVHRRKSRAIPGRSPRKRDNAMDRNNLKSSEICRVLIDNRSNTRCHIQITGCLGRPSLFCIEKKYIYIKHIKIPKLKNYDKIIEKPKYVVHQRINNYVKYYNIKTRSEVLAEKTINY